MKRKRLGKRPARIGKRESPAVAGLFSCVKDRNYHAGALAIVCEMVRKASDICGAVVLQYASLNKPVLYELLSKCHIIQVAAAVLLIPRHAVENATIARLEASGSRRLNNSRLRLRLHLRLRVVVRPVKLIEAAETPLDCEFLKHYSPQLKRAALAPPFGITCLLFPYVSARHGFKLVYLVVDSRQRVGNAL